MKKRKIVGFTIQSCQNTNNKNNKWRFYIPKEVTVDLNLHRGVKVNIYLTCDKLIETKTTCGRPIVPQKNKYYKPGYDLHHIEISQFIKDHILKNIEKRGRKIPFEYLGEECGIHTFKYLCNKN